MNDKKYFKFHIYFAHTGSLKLHNVGEEELARWNEKIINGDPFSFTVNDDTTPWVFNPEYIIHTEVHEQKIGEYVDDPRRTQ